MRHTRTVKLAGLAVLFAAGALLAGTAFADTTTTTETTTETTTITQPAQTVTTISTVTVHETTTEQTVPTSPETTTSEPASSTSSTPTWAWVLIGALVLALVAALAMLLARRGGGAAVAPQERRRRLDVAIASWAGQGWALEHQTGDSAVLRRGAEQMLVTVDDAGQIGTRPLSSHEQ